MFNFPIHPIYRCILGNMNYHTILNESNSILKMDISPDDNHIALACENGQTMIKSFIDGEVKHFQRQFEDFVNCIAYHPNGQSVISGDDRGIIVIVDLTTEKQYPQKIQHIHAVLCIAWNPNGKSFVSAGHDTKICICEATTVPFIYDVKHTLQKHTDMIQCIMYSPDGSQLISGSNDGTMRLWDLHKAECIMTTSFDTDTIVSSLVKSPNNDIFACGTSETIFLYSFSDSDFEKELPAGDYVNAIAFSPNGEWIASASNKEENSIRIWNVETNVLEETLTGENDIPSSLYFHSPYRSLIVAFDSGYVRSWTLSDIYWTSSSVQSMSMDRSLESMSLPSVGFDYENFKDIFRVKLINCFFKSSIPFLKRFFV